MASADPDPFATPQQYYDHERAQLLMRPPLRDRAQAVAAAKLGGKLARAKHAQAAAMKTKIKSQQRLTETRVGYIEYKLNMLYREAHPPPSLSATRNSLLKGKGKAAAGVEPRRLSSLSKAVRSNPYKSLGIGFPPLGVIPEGNMSAGNQRGPSEQRVGTPWLAGNNWERAQSPISPLDALFPNAGTSQLDLNGVQIPAAQTQAMEFDDAFAGEVAATPITAQHARARIAHNKKIFAYLHSKPPANFKEWQKDVRRAQRNVDKISPWDPRYVCNAQHDGDTSSETTIVEASRKKIRKEEYNANIKAAREENEREFQAKQAESETLFPGQIYVSPKLKKYTTIRPPMVEQFLADDEDEAMDGRTGEQVRFGGLNRVFPDPTPFQRKPRVKTTENAGGEEQQEESEEEDQETVIDWRALQPDFQADVAEPMYPLDPAILAHQPIQDHIGLIPYRFYKYDAAVHGMYWDFQGNEPEEPVNL